MGAYEIVVTILFLLVAAVGLWNAGKNFRLGAAETEKEARRVPLERGALWLSVGVMFLLAGLYVPLRVFWMIAIALLIGVGMTSYFLGLSFWPHVKRH